MPSMYYITLTLTGLLGCQEADTPQSNAEAEIAELSDLISNPDSFREKCKKTQSQIVKERCRTLAQRPHLFEENPNTAKAPHNNPKASTPTRKDIAPSSASCRPGESESHCREQRAVEAGSLDDAISECLRVSSKVWQYECFFNVAERRLQKRPDRYGESAELCSRSGKFAYNCYQHLSINMAGQSQKQWNKSQKKALQITNYWDKTNKRFGEEMKDIYWSTEIEIYLSKRQVLNNHLFEQLPKDAHPHVWSHISMQFLLRGSTECTLAECTDQLTKLFEGEATIPLERPKQAARMRKPSHRIRLRESETVKRIHYMHNGTRVLGNDTTEEIQISLLAAARHTETKKEWFVEAQDLSETVRLSTEK
ncbi:MAG: hypothetical protein VX278_01600 [Myxococcota bacterium]|nr:hypothetical protein [Myxococcota bacterium]